MDVIMVAVLLVCFGSMKLFADWCEKQVKVQRIMILLGAIIILLAGYLVYALVYPEKL